MPNDFTKFNQARARRQMQVPDVRPSDDIAWLRYSLLFDGNEFSALSFLLSVNHYLAQRLAQCGWNQGDYQAILVVDNAVRALFHQVRQHGFAAGQLSARRSA